MVERKGQEKRSEEMMSGVEGGRKTERLSPISDFCLQFWSFSSFLGNTRDITTAANS